MSRRSLQGSGVRRGSFGSGFRAGIRAIVGGGTVIYTTENFDGVTAPATPAGWTFTAAQGWVTSTDVPRSSPNDLISDIGGTLNSCFFDTADSNSGNVTVSASFLWGDLSSATAVREAFVVARATTKATSGTMYMVGLQIGTSDSPRGVIVFKRIAGVNTQLATVTGTWTTNVYYRVTLVLSGTSLKVQVQRDSDSNYLNSSGSWQGGQAYCIDITDSAVTGAGFAGILHYNPDTAYARTDDFDFRTT